MCKHLSLSFWVCSDSSKTDSGFFFFFFPFFIFLPSVDGVGMTSYIAIESLITDLWHDLYFCRKREVCQGKEQLCFL